MPLCLESLDGPSSGPPLDLQKCASGENSYRSNLPVKISDNSAEQNDGPREASDLPSFNGYGWATYRALASRGPRIILALTSSGGGSGIFTSLMATDRKGDVLSRPIFRVGGDRCSNGLAEVTATQDGIVHYVLFVHSEALLHHSASLADKDLRVNSAAIGCVAKVARAYDANTGTDRLTSVSLTGGTVPGFTPAPAVMVLPEKAGIFYDGKPANDGCFARLYNNFTRNQHLVLTPDEFETLAKDFKRNCLE